LITSDRKLNFFLPRLLLLPPLLPPLLPLLLPLLLRVVLLLEGGTVGRRAIPHASQTSSPPSTLMKVHASHSQIFSHVDDIEIGWMYSVRVAASSCCSSCPFFSNAASVPFEPHATSDGYVADVKTRPPMRMCGWRA
jgi:hypothetical protein